MQVQRVGILLAVMTVLALGASTAACNNGPQPPTSTTTTSGSSATLPSPPTTAPNKALIGAKVSGSGSFDLTQTTTVPDCTFSWRQDYTFDLKDQAASFSPQTGQLVVGGVSLERQPVAPEQACIGQFSIPGPSGGGWIGDMLINLTYPVSMVIPSPPQVAFLYEGAPQWVFTSAQGLRSGNGALSCKGFTLGSTFPQTVPGTPGGPNVSCTPKTSNKYTGTFHLTYCPPLHMGPATDLHNSCTGTGSATLQVDFETVTVAPNIVVSPPKLQFGETQVGKMSAPQTVTISNPPPGNAPLVIDGIGVVGEPGAATDYVLSGGTISKSCFMPATGGSWTGCASDVVLDVGQSATFQVAFAPKAVTPLDVNLTIVTNSSSPYYDVALYGMGMASTS
jgi:hypothetical protein